MKTKLIRIAPVALGIVAGYVIREIEVRKYNLPKLEAHYKEGLEKVRSLSFHSGYEAARNSASLRYEHYKEFKKLNNETL